MKPDLARLQEIHDKAKASTKEFVLYDKWRCLIGLGTLTEASRDLKVDHYNYLAQNCCSELGLNFWEFHYLFFPSEDRQKDKEFHLKRLQNWINEKKEQEAKRSEGKNG